MDCSNGEDKCWKNQVQARHSPSPCALTFPQVAIAAFAGRPDWLLPQTASCGPPTTHPGAFVPPQPGAAMLVPAAVPAASTGVPPVKRLVLVARMVH